jgi:hypothetical protein
MKIANASAFWGDHPGAAFELMSMTEDLDFLTFDYLSEVSLSIMAIQREKDPQMGYAADFIQVIKSLKPLFDRGRRCKIVSNAGGLNPLGLAQKIRALGLPLRIFVVTGDDVLSKLLKNPEQDSFCNLDTGRPLGEVCDRLVTANAYLGAKGIVEALDKGADIVITGRVADPSLTVAPCMHHFKWSGSDWPKIAQATVAGHLIECGTQVTGGISNDWLKWADGPPIGFPIAEIDQEGKLAITKAPQTGGCVSEMTVKEQLLYEIGDPAHYLSPDVSVSLNQLSVHQISTNRVAVEGAIGSSPTPFYKVSATYRAGFKVEGMITLYGDQLQEKSQAAGKRLFNHLKELGYAFEETRVELIGAGAIPHGSAISLREGVLRLAARSSSEQACKALADEIAPLVTSGPAGTTGYSSGRPHVRPLFGYWPCLIEKSKVLEEVKEVL